MLFWALAVVLGIVVAFYTPAVAGFGARPSPAEIVFLVALTLGVYGAVVAATILVLIWSRKIFWLVRHLGLWGRRQLPGPKKQRRLPRTRTGLLEGQSRGMPR